jgi:hypothetical protein
MSTKTPKVILGAGLFGSARCPDAASVKAYCDLFKSYGHTTIDSARAYPNESPGLADKMLNLAGATAWATIEYICTRHPSLPPMLDMLGSYADTKQHQS